MANQDPSNIDWGRVYAQAVAIAIAFSRRNAEDVVQEGMKLFFAGEAPWDSAGETSLPEHLVAEGRKALENKERTERRRRHPRVMGKVVHAFDQPPPTPEDDYGEAQASLRLARLVEKALEEFPEDSDAREILLLLKQGVHEALEQAEESGMDVAVVRNARKRVLRCLRALAEREKDAVGS
jgi:DNA-directed RNA polymerase specialized sigma24 family protein